MSKPASIVLGALVVIALAVVLAAFALHSKRPPSVEQQEPVATAPQAIGFDAAPKAMPTPLPPDASPKNVAPRRPPAGKDAGVLLREAALLTKLHDVAASDPALSLRLAKQALARFPDSPDAPEFEWYVVRSLSNLARFDEARDEAHIMLKKYPGTSWSNDVQRHVLSNPE
jgi:cell division septation protein DedD